MEIKGRHLIEGVPKTITITDEEIREALAETVNVIVDAVRVALERTPPELSADIVDRGIVLTGGGSMLKNLDKTAARGNRLAARDGRGSAVVGRAWRGQDAVGLQPAPEDLHRLRQKDAYVPVWLRFSCLLFSWQLIFVWPRYPPTHRATSSSPSRWVTSFSFPPRSRPPRCADARSGHVRRVCGGPASRVTGHRRLRARLGRTTSPCRMSRTRTTR